MGSKKVQLPPPRDYAAEAEANINAQIKMAPKILAAERDLIPQFQQMQLEQMMGGANNLKTFYRSVMGDSADLLGQYGQTFSNALSPIAQGARTTYEAGLGGGAALQTAMRNSAMSDLDAGMGLTPEMQKFGTQAARAAFSARGLNSSYQGMAGEILNNYNLGLDRQNRARTFAGQVLGNDVTMSNAAYQQYGSPLVSSGLQSLSPMGLAGMATQFNQNLGPQYVQPESQMGQNIASSNYNAQLQKATADAQASNSMRSGLISAAGSLAAGMATGGVGLFASGGLNWGAPVSRG